MSETTTEHDEPVNSTNAWAEYDETELLHLLELVRKGDELIVNERAHPLTATSVSDGANDRIIRLAGNGTQYTLAVSRDDEGRPTDATIHYPSGREDVYHARVENRNALMVREYDHLLTEQLESVAVSEYRDRMRRSVERSPNRQWGDLSKRDRTGEWAVEGDELTAVKWAIYAFVHHYREDGRMGGSDETREWYQEALALWERARGERDVVYFVGAEFAHVGAYLDYAVEDPDIRSRLPDGVVDAVKAVRASASVPVVEGVQHPEVRGV